MLASYLSDDKLGIVHEEAKSTFHLIKAGISQGSVLRPILYLCVITDQTTLAMFTGETEISRPPVILR